MKSAVFLALILFSFFFGEGHAQECVNGLASAERVRRVGRNRRSDRNEQQRIVPDISFNCSGTVTRWIVAGDRATMGSANNMPEVQIWRETSSGSGVYNKVHGMSLPERTEDPSQIYEFTATMDVQPGDILGLFEPFRSWLQLYYTDQFGPVNYYMDTGSAVTPPTGDFVINAADGTMNDMPQVTVEITPTSSSSASECVRNFATVDEIVAVVQQSIEDSQQRLIPGINFTCHGFITKWVLAAKWATTDNLPELQTWNSTDDTTYMKQGATTVSLEGGSAEMTYYEYSPNPPHEFNDGDVLGIFIPDRTRLAIFFVEVESGPLNYVDLKTGNDRFSPPVGPFETTTAGMTVNAVPLIAVEVSIPQPPVSVSLSPSATSTLESQTSSALASSEQTAAVSGTVGRTLTPLPESFSSSLSTSPEQTSSGRSIMDRTSSVLVLPTSSRPEQTASASSIMDILSTPLPEPLSSSLSTVSEQTASGTSIMDSALSTPLLPTSSVQVGPEQTATESSVQIGPEQTATVSSTRSLTSTPGPEIRSSLVQEPPEQTATVSATRSRTSIPGPEIRSSLVQEPPEQTTTVSDTRSRTSIPGPEILSSSVQEPPEQTATVSDSRDRTSTPGPEILSSLVQEPPEQTTTVSDTRSSTSTPGPEILSSSLQETPEQTATVSNTRGRTSTPGPEIRSSLVQETPEQTATVSDSRDRTSTPVPEIRSSLVQETPEQTATVSATRSRTSIPGPEIRSSLVQPPPEQTATVSTPSDSNDTDSSSSSSDASGTIAAVVVVVLIVVTLAGIVGVSIAVIVVRRKKGTYDLNSPTGLANPVYEGTMMELDTLQKSDLKEPTYHIPDTADYEDLDPSEYSELTTLETITQSYCVPTEDQRRTLEASGNIYSTLSSVSRSSSSSGEENYFLENDIYWAPASNESDLYSQLAQNKFREIPKPLVRVCEHLGTGNFGQVNKGVWESPSGSMEVAVKALRPGASEIDRVKFLQEAAIMGQFHHPNVIALHGVVTVVEPVMIILELMPNGDLRQHLLRLQPIPGEMVPFTTPQACLDFCCQIASGMEYLSKKAFVHRDLAARNILVAKDKTCKISDFGMARDLQDEDYYVSHGGKIPVKWTAPEAINYKKYSTATDVWSYGALMFEIWSLGHKPFEGYTNLQVISLVNNGRRLAPPPGCPRAVYKLMLQCWHPEARSRPTFSDLLQSLSRPETELLHWTEEDTKTHPQAAVLGALLEAGKDLYPDLQCTYEKDIQ